MFLDSKKVIAVDDSTNCNLCTVKRIKSFGKQCKLQTEKNWQKGSTWKGTKKVDFSILTKFITTIVYPKFIGHRMADRKIANCGLAISPFLYYFLFHWIIRYDFEYAGDIWVNENNHGSKYPNRKIKILKGMTNIHIALHKKTWNFFYFPLLRRILIHHYSYKNNQLICVCW